RNGELIVFNKPVYDLMIVPNEVKIKDTLVFCQLFDITKEEFIKKTTAAKQYSWVKPTAFLKQLSNEKFARIQGYLVDYPGFYIRPRTVRAYPYKVMSNAFGYIGEISKRRLSADST